MEEQFQNLNLDGMLSADDIKKLTELLGSNSVLLDNKDNKKSKKNKKQMSAQAKSQLLNQFAAKQPSQEPQKPLKDMNEEEKKAYREELKKRLHGKQDMFKQMRNNQNLLQKSLDAKIKKSTETMKKEDIAKALQSALPLDKMTEGQVKQVEETEELDDFVN